MVIIIVVSSSRPPHSGRVPVNPQGPPRRGDEMEDSCYELRCADVGYKCNYVGVARTKDELMEIAGKHSADFHHKTEFTDAEMAEINNAIRHNEHC